MAAPLMAGNAEAAASNAAKFGSQAWQAFKTRSPAVGKEAALGIRERAPTVKEVKGAPKQLTSNVGKTAGRNSAGRITIFHRGGGAKRLYRIIDMKRSTSSMGVIERIEYDPNRSSRIALVRWVEGAHEHSQKKCKAIEKEFVPPQKIPEPIATPTLGRFSLASLSREVNQTNASFSPPRRAATYVAVGPQTAVPPGLKSVSITSSSESKKTCARDVFLSAFSTSREKREPAPFALSNSLSIPRIAVAGAKPAFFVQQIRGKDEGKSTFFLGEIQKWNAQSMSWTNRNKRRAAVSWQSIRWKNALGFAGSTDCNEPNHESDHVTLPEGDARKPSS